jgi:guanosine-3',5'-bis(diphosphate) 3'-pyrophosphohydrolase
MSVKLIEAIRYATLMHGTQKRKAANRTHVPYMVHPLEVVQILMGVGVTDENVLCAAALHDVLEDCRKNGACEEDIRNKFGEVVLGLVLENTDDPTQDKMTQKRMQVVNAAHKSFGASVVKAADKTSNMRDIVRVPPGWSADTIRAYVGQAREVVKALPLPSIDASGLQHWIVQQLRAAFYQASQDALDAAAEMDAKAVK